MLFSYLEKASSQGVKYAEVMVDVQNHMARGLSFETIFNGLKDGIEKHEENSRMETSNPIEVRFIVSLVGEREVREALDVVEQAVAYKDLIVAIGMATSEVNLPIIKFKEVFLRAKEFGFKTTSHFWDENCSDQISAGIHHCCLDGIDHGMSVLDSAPLLEESVERKIPYTICPISLLKFRRFQSLQELRLRHLMDSGVLVSIHSDDAAYNGAYIAENYYKVATDCDLTPIDIEALARNSFHSAFMSEICCRQFQDELSQFMKHFMSHT